ncbi:23S rRNA pseudouridine(2604) synthase RluF, partial [Klebsiella pneumoniae]
EWRDLTDEELIDLFKLIENSSSEAKPRAKPKPKAATPGIKRPSASQPGDEGGGDKRQTQR